MTTRAENAKNHIRNEILLGRWAPGAKLVREDIAKSLGTSSTLVREALIGLVGENLIQASPNQGFRVPEIDRDQLAGLTELRCRIDGLGFELSFENGDVDWESRVIVAHHRLSRVEYNPENREQWVDAHRHFHNSLVSACQVDVIKSFSNILFNCTEQYRRWTINPAVFPEWMSKSEKEHAQLLELVVERKPEEAVDLLKQHHRTTLLMLDQDTPSHNQPE